MDSENFVGITYLPTLILQLQLNALAAISSAVTEIESGDFTNNIW